MTGSSVISFDNDSIGYLVENPEQLKTWLEDIALSSKSTIGYLEYVFCSDQRLLEINKTYLNHDYFTDIITFPLQEEPLEATIFISVDRVRDNSNLYQCTFIDELHRVMVHGLLHLLGYADKTEAEKTVMRAKEDACLALRSF